jgi:hypothetical protein
MGIVGLLSLELHLAGARSLKDKRMVLRSVKDRLRGFNVAVAETGHQDLWQRAALAVVTVGPSGNAVDQALSAVVDEIERIEPGVVTSSRIELLT